MSVAHMYCSFVYVELMLIQIVMIESGTASKSYMLLKKLICYILLRIKMWVFCLNSLIWVFVARDIVIRGFVWWAFCHVEFLTWISE